MLGNERLTAVSAGLGTVGVGCVVANRKLKSKIDHIENEIADLEEQLDNWYELPPQVDLSHIVENADETDVQRPYKDWQVEMSREWGYQALVAHLSNNDPALKDSDIEVLAESPWDYGRQRVYLEKALGARDDIYRTIVEIYDSEDNLINVYWGRTDNSAGNWLKKEKLPERPKNFLTRPFPRFYYLDFR